MRSQGDRSAAATAAAAVADGPSSDGAVRESSDGADRMSLDSPLSEVELAPTPPLSSPLPTPLHANAQLFEAGKSDSFISFR